jgi:ABC-type transport system involved in multi-copper enzyme maturation permease subunit
MIAKEWRDARCKFLIGTVLVLAMGVMIPLDTLFPHAYSLFGEPANVVAPSPREDAENLRYLLWSQWFTDASGNLILMLVTAIIGAGLISEESNRGTLFLALNRPISRGRVLLTKYAVNAGVLLAISLLGSVALLVTTKAFGYPQNTGGVLVSAGLMWLGLLFVLGTALLLSVALDNTLLALAGTFVIWILTSVVPAFVAQQVPVLFLSSQSEFPASLFDALAISPYWSSLAAYSGDSFPATKLLVSLATAAVPLLGALWVFKRKAY